jgi:hypothetical protein
MNRSIRTIFFALPAVLVSSAPAAGATSEQIVDILDSEHSADVDSVIRSQVTVREGAEMPQIRDYLIFYNSDGRSLMEFLDTAQRGTRILNTGLDFWFITPRTRRAIKIPPIQRLFGDASVGDILQTRWKAHYRASSELELDTASGTPELRLKLTATNKAASYQFITIWCDPQSLLPIHADYYLASGKLHKSGRYQGARLEIGKLKTDSLALSDPSKPDRVTTIKALSWEARELPDQWFTRAHLEAVR